MTSATTTDRRAAAEDATVPRLGRVCLWAGVLGAASGVVLAAAPAAVGDDRYSYPMTATAFVAAQCWFAVQHLGLWAGIVGLGRSRAQPPRAAVRLAAAGMLLLAATELAAIGAATSATSGAGPDALGALYGVSTITVGVGLTWAGAAVARHRTWTGPRRWLPLVLGAWVFIPMLPALFGGFLAARLAIIGWMLLFALLGWALDREAAS